MTWPVASFGVAFLASGGLAFGQVDSFPRPPNSPYTAERLAIGADFLKVSPPQDTVKVWRKYNSSGWTGTLFFVNPRTGQLDSLFNNDNAARRCTPSTQPCSNAVILHPGVPRPGFPAGHDIRAGDTLIFMYRVNPGYGGANDRLPKFTGPNDDSARFVGGTKVFSPASNPRYGHRWSVAGRISTTAVEFGFEDNTCVAGTDCGSGNAGPSDFDFDDVIFGLAGMSAILPPNSVQTPYAIPPGQQFTSPMLNVTLTSNTPGTRIHFTLDGTDPDSNSARFAGPIVIRDDLILKAKAYHDNLPSSGIMTEIYDKVYLGNSALQILDRNGSPVVGYLSDAGSGYHVRLTTTTSLLSANLSARTTVALDLDTLKVANPIHAGGSLHLTTGPIVPLALSPIPQAPADNRFTQAAWFDTLVVGWINPMVPGDTPSVRMPIRPAPRQSYAYFSATPDSAGWTTQFPGTADRIHVVVRDQPLPPRTGTRVRLATLPLQHSAASDTLDVPLVHVQAHGTYVGIVTVEAGRAADPSDHRLQALPGDQIVALYQDPLDGDIAVTAAGFGVPLTLNRSGPGFSRLGEIRKGYDAAGRQISDAPVRGKRPRTPKLLPARRSPAR